MFSNLYFFYKTKSVLIGFLFIVCATLPRLGLSQSNTLVISQVYGGGGNSGATYSNDFVEILNLSAAPFTVPAGGYSVQYAAPTGTSWAATAIPAGTIIPAYSYLLVQEAAGGTASTALPTPDVTGTINLATANGKVALVAGTTALSGSQVAGARSASVIDFVGYGSTATAYEGSGAAPSPSNTTATTRRNSGLTDTDDNAADFQALAVAPRNAATPALAPATVATAAPTAVGAATATTGGTVAADGGVAVTERGVVYGLTSGPALGGPNVTKLVVGAGLGAFTAALAGLASSTLYYVRAYATNARGTAYGTQQTFTTDPAKPTVPPTLRVANVATTQADITVSGGDGARQLVVVRLATTAAAVPTDGTTYAANRAFGSGSSPGAGNYVVLASATGSNGFAITGLVSGTTYTVDAYAYNDNATAGQESYLTASAATATFTTAAATYTWTGLGPDANWTTAANWQPARPTPQPADQLVFDGQTTPTVSATLDFGRQTVASLALRNKVQATFAVAGNTYLTLAGAFAEPNLLVEAGDSLQLLNTMPNVGLVIALNNGATGLIDGAIVFDGVATSTTATTADGTHQLFSPLANSITFRAGSRFTAGRYQIGSPFGQVGGTSEVQFLAGATYTHIGGTSPLGTSSTAIVAFRSGSYFRFMPAVGSVSLLLAGKTYGHFIYEPTTATAYSATGSTPGTILNDLRVLSGTFNLNLTGGVAIGGDIRISNTAVLTAAPSSAATVALVGPVAQRLSVSSTASNPFRLGSNATLQCNNLAGVTLATPVTIGGTGTVQFAAGPVTTSAAALLTLPGTLAVSSGDGYVNGPVARSTAAISSTSTTPATVVFPVGKNGLSRPLTLTINAQRTATTYTAEQFEGNPGQVFDGTSGGLQRVSYLRYYTVSSSNNVADNFSGTIALSFGTNDFVNTPTDPGLAVAKRNGGTGAAWVHLGHSADSGTGSGAGGTSVSGTVTSAVFTTFSNFALGATNANDDTNAVGPINALPVTLTSFTAQRQPGGVGLRWNTASEQKSDFFEVQRSLDGSTFIALEKITAHGTTGQPSAYALLDRQALGLAGVLYYRLRQADTDGTYTFSPVATVIMAGATAALVAYPNPATVVLHVPAAAGQPIQISDLLGRVMRTAVVPAAGELAVDDLPPGTYLLQRTAPDGQRQTTRFVKK